MALSLSTVTKKGVTADYYRIESIHWVKKNHTAVIMLALYVNSTVAHAADGEALEIVPHNITGLTGSTCTMANCYTALKTGPLAAAQDA